jgi:hypothetical protein
MAKFDNRAASPGDAMRDRYEHRSRGNPNTIVNSRPRDLKVKCSGCRRDMTVKRSSQENPPYFCYKCEDKWGE